MKDKTEDIKVAHDELQERIRLIDKDYGDKMKEYRRSLQTACNALKRQIPVRPKEEENGLSINYTCPCCGRFFGMRGMASVALFKMDNFCQNCGQAMDWRGVMR